MILDKSQGLASAPSSTSLKRHSYTDLSLCRPCYKEKKRWMERMRNKRRRRRRRRRRRKRREIKEVWRAHLIMVKKYCMYGQGERLQLTTG